MPKPTPSRPPQSPTPARISPSREAAFQILEAINANHGHSDTLLHGHHTASLSPLDRNLATTLVMGVLRWQIALDAAIVPLLSRPDPLPPTVATALRLGAFQLLHLDRIPAHAAISESVELCRLANQPQATGMVNAILRKIAARPLPFQPASPLLQLALQTAHPVWLVDRWTKTYGAETARAIAQAGQQQPPLTLRRAPDDNSPTPANWQPGAILTTSIRRESAARDIETAATEIPAPSPTQQFFMDEGSQLVAEIAALNITDTTARILDTCAAPGGKTLILAQRNPQAQILATDSSPARLKSLRQRLQTIPNIRCLQADATDLASDSALPAATHFDLILCDAPCSGTGTLARNPEIRHRLQPADLVRHAERQRHLLRAALTRLAPGGRLIYSTCSLEPEENEVIITAVLAAENAAANAENIAAPNYKQIDIRPSLDELLNRGILQPAAHIMLVETAIRNGQLRTLPGIHPTDGFFAAILERIH